MSDTFERTKKLGAATGYTQTTRRVLYPGYFSFLTLIYRRAHPNEDYDVQMAQRRTDHLRDVLVGSKNRRPLLSGAKGNY